MIALEHARRFRLVKYARTGPNELLVKLPLVVAAIPAASVQCLKPLSTHVYPVESAGCFHHPLPLAAETTHGRQIRGLGWWLVCDVVCVVERLE